jgi:hypothetical protein
MTESLAINLRGERLYLHGTDLYSAIHSAFLRQLGVQALTGIRFKIPRFYTRPVALEIRSGTHVAAVWQCSAQSQTWSGHLHEEPSSPAPRRVHFAEHEMTQSMRLTGQKAEFAGKSRWTAIEDVVFLGKFLNTSLNQPEAGKQWVFTQLELERSLHDAADISLLFESSLQNFFTKSAVMVAGVKCGAVYFAKVDRASHEMRGLK